MKLNSSCVFSGLGTDTYKAPADGMYTVSTQTTELPPSGLVITISQSGSTTASITTPTTSPLENIINLSKIFNCAAGDILSVAISSSAAADQPPNMIKSTINLRQGL